MGSAQKLKVYDDSEITTEYSDDEVSIESSSESPESEQDLLSTIAPKKTAVSNFIDDYEAKNPVGNFGLAAFHPAGWAMDTILTKEELLPLLGQLGGGAGGGYAGSVAGETIGDSVKQAKQILQGNRSGFDVADIGKNAAITALFEGAMRLPAFSAYKRLRAARDLSEGAGAELALAKGALSKMKNATQIDDVLSPLSKELDDITVKHGSQASIMNKWKIKLQSMKDAGQTHLTGKQLIQLEDDLGDAANFAKNKLSPAPKNSAANSAVKTMRTLASKKLDDFAVKSGIKSFPKLSKEVSRLISIKDAKGPGLLESFLKSGNLGALAGIATGNPLVGLGVTSAGMAASSPTVQRGAFNVLEKTGIGRAVTVGGAALLRDFLED